MTPGISWHEDDEFWRAMYPLFFGAEQWSAAPREAEQALSLLGLESGAAILDLGCGPGRHALEFARRGCRATGVDRTRSYLREARRRARAEGLRIEFVLGDMREFSRPHAFDAAVSLSTSFGYFEDPEDDARVLSNVFGSLTGGGRLLIEMLDAVGVARGLAPRVERRADDGTLFVEEQELTRGGTWFQKRREVRAPGAPRREFRIAHRLYTASKLTALLERTGFQQVSVHGGLDGSPYGERASRLTVVARSPVRRGGTASHAEHAEDDNRGRP